MVALLRHKDKTETESPLRRMTKRYHLPESAEAAFHKTEWTTNVYATAP